MNEKMERIKNYKTPGILVKLYTKNNVTLNVEFWPYRISILQFTMGSIYDQQKQNQRQIFYKLKNIKKKYHDICIRET